MAGSMNWTGMEDLISAVNTAKTEWTTQAEVIKDRTIAKLGEGYTGNAAETTEKRMSEEIKRGSDFFEEVASKISAKLIEQKRAWEAQERKSQQSVE